MFRKSVSCIFFMAIAVLTFAVFAQDFEEGIITGVLPGDALDEIAIEDLSGSVDTETQGGRFKVRLGLGQMSGDFTYSIKFPGKYTPVGRSELEFPLDVNIITLGFDVPLNRKLTFVLDVAKSISDDAGKMKDSDWGIFFDELYPYWFDPYSLDIYSESDSYLDAMMADIKLRYELPEDEKRNWKMFAGGGYRYQRLEYDVRNLVQRYPSFLAYTGYDLGADIVPGQVATYDADVYMVYGEIGGCIRLGKKLNLTASLGYSPLVNIKDDDNHMLIPKIAKSDDDGTAYFVFIGASYDITKRLNLEAGYNYLSIDAEGTQIQYYEDGSSSSGIDHKIESTQQTVGISVSYSF